MARVRAAARRGVSAVAAAAPKKTRAPRTKPAPVVLDQAPKVDAAPTDPTMAHTAEERRMLPSGWREDPNHLADEALKQFAHERGMSKSELAFMTDEKIRIDLKYIVRRQYEQLHADAGA